VVEEEEEEEEESVVGVVSVSGSVNPSVGVVSGSVVSVVVSERVIAISHVGKDFIGSRPGVLRI
jgi:hypothetical protein